MNPRSATALALLALVAPQGGTATRSDYEVWRRYRAAPDVRIEAFGSPVVFEGVDRARDRLRESDSREIEVRSLLEPTPGRHVPRVVIGLSKSDLVRAALAGAEGLVVEDGRIVADGYELRGAGDVVAFFTQIAGEPVLGVVANREEALAALLGHEPIPSRPGFRCLRFGEALPAHADLIRDPTVLEARQRYFDSLAKDDRGSIRYWFPKGAYDRAALDAIHARSVRALERLQALVGEIAPVQIDVLLYRSPAEKEWATGDARLAHANLIAARVHAVETAGLHGHDGTELARVALLRGVGGTSARWLEDGIVAASSAGEPDVEGTARALAAAGAAGTAGDLINPWTRGRRSPLVTAPLEAALAAALAQRLGPGAMRKVYLGKDSLPEPADLEGILRGALAPPASRETSTSAAASDRRARVLAALPMRGVALARAPRGADAGAMLTSLDHIRDLGADAVLLTAARMLDPEDGGFGESVVGRGPLGTSDEELAWIADACHQRGLSVMFRSEIEATRLGKWFGDAFDVERSSKWRSYFEDFRECLLHDALFAERIGAEWLVAGSEMRGATWSKGAAARWGEELARARRVFTGAVTYVASWAPVSRRVPAGVKSPPPESELEKCRVWPHVDAIGAAAYVPLAASERPSDEDLAVAARAFAEQLGAISSREGKPALIVDVGISATAGALRTPWRPNGRRDESAPERGYRALAAALAARPWLGGIVVREWPIGAASSDTPPDPFSIAGQPGESWVKALFRCMERR